ncbi:hypothetical protein QR680_017130 [Steinernema hermaphroditum]|uniref:Uncharacterized protein n=1 Tax=Steinernema hermaphroditum TaxID=289476 RepID=A0AA39LNS8_9BILA|nr:hypothetical protein QR680_017130 [Steinernema hermaphroditum]
MKKRSRGRNKKIDPEDFEELSSSSWVSTLPSRYSTMSCPTDESTTYSTTKTTEQSGLSQTQSTELSNAQSSTVVPSYSTVAVDKTRKWIEAVEAFLTDEVMCHTIAPQRRPILSVRGKKPSGFAKGYRNLYRNLMNKKSPTGK